MPSLAQLIDARRTLEAQGISIAPAVDTQIKGQEDKLIEEELYRALRNAVRDTLSVLDRPITFTLQYDPNAPDSYPITHSRVGERKRGARGAKEEADQDEAPAHTRSGRAGISRLRITLNDGTLLEEKTASDTLRAFVYHVGYKQVQALGLRHNRADFIFQATEGDDLKHTKLLAENYYVRTDSTTGAKIKQIEKISAALGLGVTVEKVRFAKPEPKGRKRRTRRAK